MAENMASDGGAMEHEVSTIRKMYGFIPKEQGKNNRAQRINGVGTCQLEGD